MTNGYAGTATPGKPVSRSGVGRRRHARTARRPHSRPRILAACKKYGWGAKKLLRVLATRDPTQPWPGRSTVNDILARHGLLRKHRRRTKWAHPGAVPLVTDRPNQAGYYYMSPTLDGRNY